MDWFRQRKRDKRAIKGLAALEEKRKKEKQAILAAKAMGPLRFISLKMVVDNPKPEPFNNIGSRFRDGNSFANVLIKRGYEQIGSGAFSQVLAKPGSNRVIKVCRNPDGWGRYVKWAAEMGWAGKFAPKVYSYKYFPSGKFSGKRTVGHSFYVATMERLDKTLNKLDKEHKLKYVHNFMQYGDGKNPTIKMFLNMIVPGLDVFTHQFYDRFKGEWMDLHGGNFMTRTGTNDNFVLIDPITSTPELTNFRSKAA